MSEQTAGPAGEVPIEVAAVRASHDRLTQLLGSLPEEALTNPSYDSDWSIAQVASHLGSQAEIFALFLEAGLAGGDAPGGEVFQQIWARWDAMHPSDQVAESVSANERFVDRLEEVARQGAPFSIDLFGSRQGLDGLARMRLSEHALHTWDIAVALDPDATVSADAVSVIVGGLGALAARAGRSVEGAKPVVVVTTEPDGRHEVTLSPEVALTASEGETASSDLHLSSEALVRLVYGRLDPDHTPGAVRDDPRLAPLREAFPGF